MAYQNFSSSLRLCAAAFVLSLAAASPAYADRSIETIGTLSAPDEGQIAPDIWVGTSRSDALALTKALPTRFASPTFYRLARRYLLSDAPQISDADQGTSPDLLTARIDKLLEIGALHEANDLYESAVDGVPDNFDLAFRSLQILMLRGELSAACLDLQTMQSKHGQDARWRELNALCMIRYADGPTRAKILSENTFEQYPILSRLLGGGIVPSRLSSLDTTDLAFASALGFVNEAAMRQLTSQSGALPSLLLTVLYNAETENNAPEKTCLAIEAVRRGLLTTRDLITLYEAPHYDAALLLDNVKLPPSAANIHPCMIPTVLYQRIASHKDHPDLDTTMRVALDVMRKMPDASLLPMATYFQKMNLQNAANAPYAMRVARIIAYEKESLPESWEQGWDEKGVSPVWLVHAIVKPELATPENLTKWREAWPVNAKVATSRDPYLPVILGKAATAEQGAKDSDSKASSSKAQNYDNNIPLTFSRTYAMPSYGLTQRLKSVIEKGHTGQSVALLLIGYGAIPPDQIIPDQMAVIIEGMNKQGLRGDSRRLALEILR